MAQRVWFSQVWFSLATLVFGYLDRPSNRSPPILSSAEARGGNLSNQQHVNSPSLGLSAPGVGPQSSPAQGPGPSLCFCLAGWPGFPRELGAADHCPGARGGLHLLPEAAAAPDAGAEQQGRGQWVQLQRHSRSWVCTGYLCSLSPLPCSLPPTPACPWAANT